MSAQTEHALKESLAVLGFAEVADVYANPPAHRLIEEAVRRGEGRLAPGGALVVETGQHTGRSPKDKYVVQDDLTREIVRWGAINHPMTPVQFEHLRLRILTYLQERELFVVDAAAGADSDYRIPV